MSIKVEEKKRFHSHEMLTTQSTNAAESANFRQKKRV